MCWCCWHRRVSDTTRLQSEVFVLYFIGFHFICLIYSRNRNNFLYIIGSHTIGDSRCTSFRQRLYNQTGNGKSDFTLDQNYAAQLRTKCPRSGGDQNLFVLDFVTPLKFDNNYYKNLLANKGLLNSDEVLLTKNQVSADLVKKYAERNDLFFEQFAKSMVKMGNISPLTGSRGEIRKICRRINHWPWSDVTTMLHEWKLHLQFVDLLFT